MLGTLCGIVWNAPLALGLTIPFFIGIAFTVAALAVGRIALWIGLGLCLLSVGAFFFIDWFSATPHCRVARVVREQVSHEYVSHHFACDAEDRTLRGVSRRAAEIALAQCDEDRWYSIARVADDNVVHNVLRCQTSPEIELWADHFTRWNGPRDWDVCFTACRAGECSASTIVTHHTE